MDKKQRRRRKWTKAQRVKFGNAMKSAWRRRRQQGSSQQFVLYAGKLHRLVAIGTKSTPVPGIFQLEEIK